MVGQKASDKVGECICILEELYGLPEVDEIDPVDLLVRTILSQNTSDINSLRAFASLKRAYGDYESLLSTRAEEVAESIREGGLAEIKARRIQEALMRIKSDRGAIEIGFLGGMEKEAAMSYLLSLPGVGPKTASIVLLFAFGMPFMPVDTHVFRVSQRLGLVAPGLSPEKAQKALEEIVPPERYSSFHLNLISHGRLVCRARGPKCEECALKGCCDFFLQGQKP
ncbi:endonuclease III domain-containing protein [Methanothrix sp.]|uniref:endonuclease III domain-containing protein n=1 Tax=Methanothrix sp. TaxID=90426 RepID=UPI003C715920